MSESVDINDQVINATTFGQRAAQKWSPKNGTRLLKLLFTCLLCSMGVFFCLMEGTYRIKTLDIFDVKTALPWTPFSISDRRPRILVTGGCGFVGGHLLPKLVLRYPGATIKVVDNLWRGNITNVIAEDHAPYIDLNKDLLIADLSDERVSDHVTKNVDLIIHLADIVAGIDFVMNNQHFLFQINMRINMNVIRSAKRNKVRDFVYTGTACSFPKHLQSSYQMTAIPENMTYPANPESAYGWSKLMGEYELNIAKEPGVFNVGIVRFHNLYGDRINYGPNRSQALPSLVRKAIMHPKESLSLWGSGKQYRDFLHVSDAVNGILATIERGMNKGAVQIGTGVATSLEDAASEISYLAKKLLNKDVNFIPDRTKMEGDMGRVADLTRARDILKWKAQISFKQGMESMFRWILQESIPCRAQRSKHICRT